MCRWAIVCSLLISACSAPHAKRLPDGSYAVECETQKVCLDRAERQCGPSGYRIIGGQHGQKLAGIPGEEKVVGLDRLQIRCKTDPINDTAQPTASVAVANPDASAALPPRGSVGVCRPGETQTCVGAGACKGGQACKSDGTGFEPCDCGDSTPSK